MSHHSELPQQVAFLHHVQDQTVCCKETPAEFVFTQFDWFTYKWCCRHACWVWEDGCIDKAFRTFTQSEKNCFNHFPNPFHHPNSLTHFYPNNNTSVQASPYTNKLTQNFSINIIDHTHHAQTHPHLSTAIPEDTLVNLSEKFLNSQKNQGIRITRINRFIIEKLLIVSEIVLKRFLFLQKKNSMQNSNVFFKIK